MVGDIYLVRHGRYKTGGALALTPEGVDDAAFAVTELVERGLGSAAVILSSSADRALPTARIIASGLRTTDIISSPRIEIGGNHPRAIGNLDDWITKSLEEERAPSEFDGLVVVTHAPLIAIAWNIPLAQASKEVAHGYPYEYQPGSWSNPGFSAGFGQAMEEEIANSRASK